MQKVQDEGALATAAMDILLRLIRDIPGSLDYLRKHAA